MYDFTDTTEQAAANKLPAEAVSINGIYIEDEISGYRTLYTSGRESLEKEFESYDDTVASGSLTKYTRFPARTITVGFQLLTSSPESFREAFNRLNEILNTEDAEIIFNDEQDKFFTGSPIMNADIEPGLMNVKGEYQIYCADPFKYSVDWHSPDPVIAEDPETGLYQTFNIEYEGTYPAYPRYIARFYNPDGETDEDNAEFDQTDMTGKLGGVGACKFVAFMDDENHVLQFGNPDTEDEADVPEPLDLNYRSFVKKGSYDPLKNGEEWVSPATGSSLLGKYKQQGSLGTGPAVYTPVQQVIKKDELLLATTSADSCKYRAIVTQVDGRTSSKATLHIQVKLSGLKVAISKGATLTVEVTHGSKTVTKILKSSSVSWKKGTAHSCSFSMNVEATTAKTEITGIRLKVTRKNGTYKYKDGKKTKTKTATGSAGKLSSRTCKPVVIPDYRGVGETSYYLRPSGYGNPAVKTYTGPAATWTYPSSGLPETDDAVGAAFFELNWSMKFCMGKTVNETLQMGAFEVLILTGDSMDANGNITNQKTLAGFRVEKTNTSSKGTVRLNVGGKRVYEQKKKIDLTWKKGLLGNSKGSVACSIETVAGDTKRIRFKAGGLFKGKTRSFALPESMVNNRAYKIVFGFYRWAASPPFDFNGIRSVRFTKKYKEEADLETTPFQAAQTLAADSSSCEVTLDDLPRPDLGALGNDWEQMCLVPGINEISTAFSQRPENTVKVMRRCRDDEPYQGAGVYDTDDDGNVIDVAEDGRDVAVYYTYNGTAGTEPEGSVFFYETETTDSSGKRIVTASGTSFKETAVTADQFDASTQSYFVLEDPVPSFSVEYREVYL